MYSKYLLRAFLYLLMLNIHAIAADIYYEGTNTFRGHGKVDLNWMVQFLPYNPVIFIVGADEGTETIYAARIWPNGKVIACEPHPHTFDALQKAIFKEGLSNVITHQVEVQSSILDAFCAKNDIRHIDILDLNTEGEELSILQASPEILKTVKLIILPSFFYSAWEGVPNYFVVKDFLATAGFLPLAHWYTQGERGRAVYISRELYDAYFVRCLGLGLGGLAYP